MTHSPRWFIIFSCTLLTAVLLVSPLRAADENGEAAASAPKPAASQEGETAAPSNAIEASVVKIFAQVRRPDLMRPWTKQPPREVTGSGVVMEGNRILTNAHVILYSSQVQVQGHQSGDKVSATVEMIAPGIDLAILKLEDESFFLTRPALARASDLPEIKDTVHVYGYPTGGTSLSITKGIISRIEFTGYNNFVSGLRIQIDAALNPGNSGGPALVGDKVVGLAFSGLSNAQNIGYIIPCEEIELFLKDAADGRYDGKPALFEGLQTLENTALRSFLKVDKGVNGIVIHDPYSTDADYPLKRWDIIARIGDKPVDDQGMVRLNEKLRLRFTYFVQHFARGGKVPLTVVRGGKEVPVEVPVSTTRPQVISQLVGDYPPYFIYGPLVFSVATEDLVSAFASGNMASMAFNALSATGSPLISRRNDKPAFDGEELVLVPAPFFPHKLTKGYANMIMCVLESVNGMKVKNLKHLVEILRDSKDEYLVFETAGRGGEAPVFPREALAASTEEVLTDNGIRTQGSPELILVWNAIAPAPAAAAAPATQLLK